MTTKLIIFKPLLPIKIDENGQIFQKNERDKIILTFGDRTIEKNIFAIDNGWNCKHYNSDYNN